jgi:hypothetical protein
MSSPDRGTARGVLTGYVEVCRRLATLRQLDQERLDAALADAGLVCVDIDERLRVLDEALFWAVEYLTQFGDTDTERDRAARLDRIHPGSGELYLRVTADVFHADERPDFPAEQAAHDIEALAVETREDVRGDAALLRWVRVRAVTDPRDMEAAMLTVLAEAVQFGALDGLDDTRLVSRLLDLEQ